MNKAKQLAVVLMGLISSSGAVAECLLAQRQNPVTGHNEKVYVESDGHDLEVLWSEQIAGSWQPGVSLTDNSVDDSCPQLAFHSDGSTAVVWRQGGSLGTVLFRVRYPQGSTWLWRTQPVVVSDGTRDASTPVIAIHGGKPWIVWHEHQSGQPTRVMGGEADGLEPWPTLFDLVELGATSYGGPLLATIQAESGHLWSTWVHSSTELRYREWDEESSSWGAYVSVAIQGGDVAQAQVTARNEVLD